MYTRRWLIAALAGEIDPAIVGNETCSRIP